MERASVRASVAPVLAARRVNSEQVTQALLGAPVTILERSARWARIRMRDEYEGWISTAHLAPPLASSLEWVTMTDLWVNLRTEPDFRMPARTLACIGVNLPLFERRPGWLGVALPGGSHGWLEEHRGHLHPPEERLPAPTPKELLATARRFLGVPYLWGGCSPLGLDCSGFVQLVHRLHGVALPRDADQQAMVGTPLQIAGGRENGSTAIGAGDAVFFGAAGALDRIVHVGLALGDGRFIHAAGSDRVRINALSDSPYGERLVAARRYLPGASVEGVSAPMPLASREAGGRTLIE